MFPFVCDILEGVAKPIQGDEEADDAYKGFERVEDGPRGGS